MRTYTRHQLKHDQFTEAAKGTVHWAVEHRQKVVWGAVAVAVALALGLGLWFYRGYRENRATEAFAGAMSTYSAPLQTEEQPAQSGQSFASAAERARAAHTAFLKVASEYSGARTERMARYFAGVTALELGDQAGGERELKQVIESADADLAALAKLALANDYRSIKRDAEAVKLYNELIAEPARTVPREAAQLELAALFAGSQPDQARRLYEEIKKQSPQGAAGQIADIRLQALK